MSKEMIIKEMMEDAIQFSINTEFLLYIHEYMSAYKEHCEEYGLTPHSHIIEEGEKAERTLEEKIRKVKNIKKT